MNVTEALSSLHSADRARNASLVESLKDTNASFGSTLTQAIADVSELQSEASTAVQDLISGGQTDLHDVMIAVEKARTSFDLLLEVRNKTLDMYREIMRMQV